MQTCDMQTIFWNKFFNTRKPIISSLVNVEWEDPTGMEWRELFLETELKSSAS